HRPRHAPARRVRPHRQVEARSPERGAEGRGSASVRQRGDPTRADGDVRSERIHDQTGTASSSMNGTYSSSEGPAVTKPSFAMMRRRREYMRSRSGTYMSR